MINHQASQFLTDHVLKLTHVDNFQITPPDRRGKIFQILDTPVVFAHVKGVSRSF